MEIKRGDIWYVSKDNYTGCEQAAGRPAIIVSNEKNNACAETVEVVYLTTQPKKDLPTHVLIRSSERESTALCEQITTVSVDRLLGYKGHLTPAEMTNVEVAMLISLELEVGKPVEKSWRSRKKFRSSGMSRYLRLRQIRTWLRSWPQRKPSAKCSRSCTRAC